MPEGSARPRKIGLLGRLRANAPRRKPQLWENLPLALWRKSAMWLGCHVETGWLDRPRVVRLAEHGLLMEVVPRNYYIDGFLYVFGVYEISGTRLFQTLLAPGMTVIDVGANIGYYTLLASKLVGPEGRVEAFEPAARMRDRLERNLRLNRVENVRTHREAVGACTGTVDFYLSNYDRNQGISSTLAGFGRNASPDRVPSTSLDEIARGLEPKRVDLVKIDVEGGEKQVLDGAVAVLSRADAPAVLFESYEIDALAPRLERLGYTVRCLHYSIKSGLEFYKVGETFENVFAGYEGINYVALKEGNQFGSFSDISQRSRRSIPRALQILGAMG